MVLGPVFVCVLKKAAWPLDLLPASRSKFSKIPLQMCLQIATVQMLSLAFEALPACCYCGQQSLHASQLQGNSSMPRTKVRRHAGLGFLELEKQSTHTHSIARQSHWRFAIAAMCWSGLQDCGRKKYYSAIIIPCFCPFSFSAMSSSRNCWPWHACPAFMPVFENHC